MERRVFTGGDQGEWEVVRCEPVVGEGLPSAGRLAVQRLGPPDSEAPRSGDVWTLRGTSSNLRYTAAHERSELQAVSAPLGRPAADRAALIPLSKSADWWALAQDERRQVIEEQSRHIATGLAYLPAVARELSHGRDLGEPFDFLTWFEYSHDDAAAFEELVATLRSSPEWAYVDREVDLRLVRRTAALR